jgi:hypothetical protein
MSLPRTPKGTRPGGRQKGSPNKLTVGVKDALRVAFTEAGGVDYLLWVARKEPKVFCALLAKLLPSAPAPGGEPEPLLLAIAQLSDDQLHARTARALAERNGAF